MRMQRFTAPDMRRAMRQVKDQLGAEAVILSSKKHATGVELVAAVDCDESLAAVPKQFQKNGADTQKAPAWKTAMESKPSLKERALAGFSRNGSKKTQPAFSSDRFNAEPAQKRPQQPAQAPASTEMTRAAAEHAASSHGQPRSSFGGASFAAQVQQQLRAREQQNSGEKLPEHSLKNDQATFSSRATQHQPQQQRQPVQASQQFSQTVSQSAAFQSQRNTAESMFADDQAYQKTPSQVQRPVSPAEPQYQQPTAQVTASSPQISFDQQKHAQDMSKIEAQIADLKAMMQQMEKRAALHQRPHGDATEAPDMPQSSIASKLQQQFSAFGLSRELGSELGERFSDLGTGAGFERGVRSLTEQLSCIEDDVLSREGVIALVGPTGAGKTTTIAKLAARYVMRYGPKSLLLINNDNYRIGAKEQLRTYGRILGVDVVEAENTQQMHHILDSMQGKKLALIDTTGISEQNSGIPDWLVPGHARIPVNRYLVLPAIGQLGYQQHAIERFSALGLDGCVLSKVDEALGLGESLGALIESQLPLLAVTNGQRVPEDLSQPAAADLVEQALKLHKRSAANNEFKDKLFNAFR